MTFDIMVKNVVLFLETFQLEFIYYVCSLVNADFRIISSRLLSYWEWWKKTLVIKDNKLLILVWSW